MTLQQRHVEAFADVLINNAKIMSLYRQKVFAGGIMLFRASVNIPPGVLPELWRPYVSVRSR